MLDRHSRLPRLLAFRLGTELVADELDPWYGEWVGSQWKSEIPARRPLNMKLALSASRNLGRYRRPLTRRNWGSASIIPAAHQHGRYGLVPPGRIRRPVTERSLSDSLSITFVIL